MDGEEAWKESKREEGTEGIDGGRLGGAGCGKGHSGREGVG